MSFLSWLTGRDEIKLDEAMARNVIDEIRAIPNAQVRPAQIEIYEAINKLNGVTGVRDCIGKEIDVTAFDEIFTNIENVIKELAKHVENSVEEVVEYNNAPLWKKFLSTQVMLAAKGGEGILSIFECLGDGAASVIGWIAPKDSGLEKACNDFINKNWSHDIFNGYYNSKFAKASWITEDGALSSLYKYSGMAAECILCTGMAAPITAKIITTATGTADQGTMSIGESIKDIGTQNIVIPPPEIDGSDDKDDDKDKDDGGGGGGYYYPTTPPTPQPTPAPTPEPTTTPSPTPTPQSTPAPTPTPTIEPQVETPEPTLPQPPDDPGDIAITGPTIPGGDGDDPIDKITDLIPDNPDNPDNPSNPSNPDIIDSDENVSNSLTDIIGGNDYTKIPTSSDPIIASTIRPKKSTIPIIAGLSAATIAGLGTKAYIDRKENEEEEDIEAEDWNEEESLGMDYNQDTSSEGDYLTATDEYAFSSDEDPVAVEYEAKENNTDLSTSESDYLIPTDEKAFQE